MDNKKFTPPDNFYKQIIESLEDYAVFTTDIKGQISSWNSGAQRLLGYKEPEIIGKNAKFIFTPEDQKTKQHKNELETALNAGKARDERWHVKKDGTRFWGSGLVFPLKDESGEIYGFTKVMRDLTTRKRLQQEREDARAIVENERKRLYDFFMQAPALIGILKGRDGKIDLCNPQFSKLWGHHDVLGKTMHAAWPELEGQHYFEMIEKVYDSGKSIYVDEFPAKIASNSDGVLTDAYFNFVFAPSRDVAGKVEGVLIFGFEVTEQVRSRQRLQISENRLQLAQKSAKVGSFEWNIQTGEFIWTPELAVLYGITIKADTNRKIDWYSVVHTEDHVKIKKHLLHSVKTGEDFVMELRAVWPDKSLHYIAVRAQVFKDIRGKPARMVGINIDVTERKLIDQNLQFLAEASKVLSSSLDYQTTLNSVAKLAVPEVADWCAIDMLDANRELQQVAVAHKDPKKIRWAKQYREEHKPDMEGSTGIAHILQTGKSELYPIITEEMLVASVRDKKLLKVIRELGFTSAMIVPIFRGGKPVGAITFVTTETRRHYNETDLSMAEELAARASLAIDNAWLYKGSQDAITLRDDFISVASHELKTPVTSVKIFTQVLQKHSEQIGDEKAKNYLSKMDKQINKLTELIYNLLDISKIQAGRIDFEEKLFDFDDLLLETIDVLQQSAPKHTIIVEGRTKKEIVGDGERISQVLSNLISNAIKYSPKADKVVVHLSVEGDNVQVCVQDFGVGIAKEHLAKIFERFYRVFDTTDKTFPGLGIGLYISAEIIKRHHGKFWVNSETGKGSQFFFS